MATNDFADRTAQDLLAERRALVLEREAEASPIGKSLLGFSIMQIDRELERREVAAGHKARPFALERFDLSEGVALTIDATRCGVTLRSWVDAIGDEHEYHDEPTVRVPRETMAEMIALSRTRTA